jgi:cytochrome c oxidase cbb3-type subunit III
VPAIRVSVSWRQIPDLTMIRRLVYIVAIFWAGDFLLLAQGQHPVHGGHAVYDTTCAGCHGLDAHGGEAPNIGAGSRAQSLTNDQLRHILHDGLPGGMPAFGSSLSSSQLDDVIEYLRQLQQPTGANAVPEVSGHPGRGRDLFFGRAECSQCHMAQGQGGFLASDLSKTRLGLPELRDSILKPPTSPGNVLTTIVLRNGATITGLLRNEDNFSMQLQDQRGAFHLLDKQEVASISRDNKPFMPSDYGQRLSEAELADLLSYIIQIRGSEPLRNSQVTELGIP